ncbi:MAG: SGNH/GDSL hydrolase family protein, partial [Bradyrhizobiaceae bacterium]|nr:SGNH/GDSL hydrolase family protein [Bradyrhizobiaceae bacterium]
LGTAWVGTAWVGTWGASPQLTSGDLFGTAPVFNNQTIRQVIRISAGGTQFRVRLSNEYGTQAVQIGDAHVAVSAGGAAIKAGTDRTLTFSRSPTVTIPPNAAVLSDPVNLEAASLTSLAVSIYLPQATGPATWHVEGKQTAYIVTGDLTGAADVSAGATTTTERFFLTGILAASAKPRSAVVTFGDSITDGTNSTPDADHRWPDFLAARLAASDDGDIGVVDEGISGNRLLHDIIGPSALSRFDRDVLATPGLRFITVLLGINDIGLGGVFPAQTVTADDIIAAHRQIIARAHGNGIRIYGCTLTPFNGVGPPYYTPAGDVTRQTVNAWIRTGGEYDAVIDFDAVVRDPADPSRILPAFDSGDHLHPNDAGYQAMANAIDLRLFRAAEDAR